MFLPQWWSSPAAGQVGDQPKHRQWSQRPPCSAFTEPWPGPHSASPPAAWSLGAVTLNGLRIVVHTQCPSGKKAPECHAWLCMQTVTAGDRWPCISTVLPGALGLAACVLLYLRPFYLGGQLTSPATKSTSPHLGGPIFKMGGVACLWKNAEADHTWGWEFFVIHKEL